MEDNMKLSNDELEKAKEALENEIQEKQQVVNTGFDELRERMDQFDLKITDLMNNEATQES